MKEILTKALPLKGMPFKNEFGDKPKGYDNFPSMGGS